MRGWESAKGVLKVPRPVHQKQKPEAIERFKTEGWAEKLAELDIPQGQAVRFWVMDESRFGLHSVVRRCWGLRSVRVVKPVTQKYEWDYLYGAIDVLNGEPVWEFLRQLVATQPEAYHVVLWDGAGFHQPPPAQEDGWQDLAQVRTIKLPPYCPELNPSEKIWDPLKDTIGNRVFSGIEELREALLPKLQSFWRRAAGLSSLIGQNWLRHQANVSYLVNIPVFN
jgi:transposase